MKPTPIRAAGACYTSNLRPFRFMALFLVCLGASAAAQDAWTAPARELARRVVERAGKPSSVALSVKNASALPDTEAAKIQRILAAQFREFGVELLEPARAVADVRVTLSENAQGHLWTAEIRQGQQREIVMLGFERSAARSGAEEKFTVTLRRLLLLESQEPILDVAKLDLAGQPALLVLHGSRLALYRPSAEGWQQDASLYLRTERPLPRDLRGRLVANKSLNFDAYLPGTKCSGSVVARLGAECKSSDDPWPLTADSRVNGFIHPSRNFFNALSVRTGNPAMNVLPFFSVAASERAPWVFAGADGVARVEERRETKPLVGTVTAAPPVSTGGVYYVLKGEAVRY